jgi:hypothetical protein
VSHTYHDAVLMARSSTSKRVPDRFIERRYRQSRNSHNPSRYAIANTSQVCQLRTMREANSVNEVGVQVLRCSNEKVSKKGVSLSQKSSLVTVTSWTTRMIAKKPRSHESQCRLRCLSKTFNLGGSSTHSNTEIRIAPTTDPRSRPTDRRRLS